MVLHVRFESGCISLPFFCKTTTVDDQALRIFENVNHNVLPNRFNFGGMREGVSDSCKIHRQTFNAGAELLTYSALHPSSTPFYKLKLAIIYLRISKLYSDWLIQCSWNKTKDKEAALFAVNGVLGLARRW